MKGVKLVPRRASLRDGRRRHGRPRDARALAVARELRARGHSVRFIGTRRGHGSETCSGGEFPHRVDRNRRIESRRIAARRCRPWRNCRSACGRLRACCDRARPRRSSRWAAYVAGPVLLAALWKRIPVVVMEPNAIPGFTHRKLARFVARALVSFPETARWFPEGRSEVTGMPVREEFFAIPPKPRGDGALTILITGGSQGSRTLNRAAQESWPLWEKDRRATDSSDRTARLRRTRAEIPRSPECDGEISAFLADMPGAFAAGGHRGEPRGHGHGERTGGGGQAVDPGAVCRLPAISISCAMPRRSRRAGAARLVLDAELNGRRLVEEVTRLSREPGSARTRWAKPRECSRSRARRVERRTFWSRSRQECR